ncbi:hypothetical protein ElyMa_005456900 [Elysia marginata]|uniref:Uncharacterized protein n=1 Tax=Elysia marginata TaxID=1093978 RepID=A0AAV4ENM5_9GAST|nr:hypothetical protein ElyMa_005456900 [Elysia marginata]
MLPCSVTRGLPVSYKLPEMTRRVSLNIKSSCLSSFSFEALLKVAEDPRGKEREGVRQGARDRNGQGRADALARDSHIDPRLSPALKATRLPPLFSLVGGAA